MAIEIPHKKTASFSVSDIRHTDTNRMPHRSSANFLNGMMISYSFFHLCFRIIAACSRSCSSFSGLSTKSVRCPCRTLDTSMPKSLASFSAIASRMNTLRFDPTKLSNASNIGFGMYRGIVRALLLFIVRFLSIFSVSRKRETKKQKNLLTVCLNNC